MVEGREDDLRCQRLPFACRKETLYNVHCTSVVSIGQTLTLLAPLRLSPALLGFEEFLGHSIP